ncbi:MAG: fatty acid desaturase [Legionellaceae bacterium]|nr:fatty acid desaturase [Legionellaceae bacterium]
MKIITKIHGKMYDLTNFKHPGGKVPLALLHNNDATCLFESYHPMTNRETLQKILSQYEIEEDKTIIEQKVYDFSSFKEDEFVIEVREEVRDFFSKIAKKKKCSLIQATKASKYKLFQISTLYALSFISLFFLASGYWSFILISPIIFWLYIANTWHDAGHFAFSDNKNFEAFILLSAPFMGQHSYRWYSSHTFKHHSYPNVLGYDSDISTYCDQGVSRYLNPQNMLQSLNKKIKKFITIPLGLEKPFKHHTEKTPDNHSCSNENIIMETYKNRSIVSGLLKNYKYSNMSLIFFLLYITSTLGINFYKGSYFFAFISFVAPFVILSFAYYFFTQINHIHECNFTHNNNYYKHQIATAYNISTQSKFVTFISGGLNCQIEHHLFPSINHCHLPKLAKIIRPICIKHNINYNENLSLFSALKSLIFSAKVLNKDTIDNYNFKKKKDCV